MSVPDTRNTLKSFEGTDVAVEFARREAIARKQFEERLAVERKKKARKSSNWLGSLSVIKPGAGGTSGMVMMESGPDGERAVAVPSVGEEMEKGKMLHDQIRERGQKHYEMMEREIRENAEKWMKEIKAEEKAAEEKFKKDTMNTMKSGFTGWFSKKDGQEDEKAVEER